MVRNQWGQQNQQENSYKRFRWSKSTQVIFIRKQKKKEEGERNNALDHR